MKGFSDSTGKGFSMLNRLSFIIAVSIVLSSQQIVGASPVTYDFTGTLNQPVDGSTTFTGSFTINANPTVNLVANPYVAEDGSDVSLSVNLGGHTINYVNTPQLSDSATFQLTWYSPSSVQSFFVETPGVTALPTLEFSVQGRGNITFGMGFDKPGGVEQLSNLRDISFPLNSSDSTGLQVGGF